MPTAQLCVSDHGSSNKVPSVNNRQTKRQPGHVHPVALVSVWWHSRYGARFLYELALCGGLLVIYRSIRTVSKSGLVEAFANAASVIEFETKLGLFFEPDLQAWLLEHPNLIRLMNHYYVWMHFPAAIGMLGWLYFRHGHKYRGIRNLMAVVTFLALVIHLVYPLAPPRMMTTLNLVDTLRMFGPTIYPVNILEGAANQLAAMPSLHFGWALIEALSVAWVLRSRWRFVALIHPAFMTLCIISTGNHWWLDAAVAGLLIVIAIPVLVAAGKVWRRYRSTDLAIA